MAGAEIRRFEKAGLEAETARTVLILKPYVDRWVVIWELVSGGRLLARKEFPDRESAYRLFSTFDATVSTWEWPQEAEAAGWWRYDET